jgi:hypothetical protein
VVVVVEEEEVEEEEEEEGEGLTEYELQRLRNIERNRAMLAQIRKKSAA